MSVYLSRDIYVCVSVTHVFICLFAGHVSIPVSGYLRMCVSDTRVYLLVCRAHQCAISLPGMSVCVSWYSHLYVSPHSCLSLRLPVISMRLPDDSHICALFYQSRTCLPACRAWRCACWRFSCLCVSLSCLSLGSVARSAFMFDTFVS